ncbi:acyltransferase 3 [Massariosphaeria phaeospora]|uniref:Acyltransferase 3 n=1 Tax=Massariosphaeria phaeospora TaxID=100035 RepID=A0A7C8M6S3_9PLEO|nr:acyltransferase 3 [Massariosphaeria phaeospora]
MTQASRSSLDGAPLLEAHFEEKISPVSQNPLMRPIEFITSKFSAKSIIAILRPSFLDRSASQKPPHPTAWLDGIRGYASFFVFVYHFQHLFHQAYNFGYASNNGDRDHWLIQLPIIRLIFTGGPMVSVFWVLSGVSLSLKPLQLARNQNWDKFFDTLFSSVFRRALRLYLPVFFVQLCVLVAACLGFYNHAFALSKEWPFGGTNEVQFDVKEINTEQIQYWAADMWKLVNPFKPHRPKHDVHLWTIPLEFRNSIILFATLVGYSKLRSKVRIALTAALYLFCVAVEEGDAGLFIAGMGLAEYLLIRDEHAKQLPSAEKVSEFQSKRVRIAWGVVCFVGLYLLSWPAWKYETTPGYTAIYNLTPTFIHSQEMTWSRIGAAVFLLAMCGSEYLRKPFSTPFAIYMGKISFPLYIVHGPLNHIIGTSLVEFFWSFTGHETLFTYEFGVIAAFYIEAVVVVWLADILMRTVDTPSVRLGRTLQNKWSC